MSATSVEEKLDGGEKHTPVTPVTFDAFDDPNIGEGEELDEDSPYPEVRSAVANTDDPNMPVNTFRVWLFGLIWAILIPGLNQFFYFRYPAVTTYGSVQYPLMYMPTGGHNYPDSCASRRHPNNI